MTAHTHDAIIIGAGQGGSPLAGALAHAGWRTALVERKHAGGTCINTGCTPTKTMVASARAAWLARRASDYGIRTGAVSVDMSQVRKRKDDIVHSFRDAAERKIENAGVELVRGTARFTSRDALEVGLSTGGTQRLSAATIVIDTGTRPSAPPLPGLDSTPWLNSDDMLELDVVPPHLLVIGGGYVGLEIAQMYRRFGSSVTLVEKAERLLIREDPDVSHAVADILRDDGIELHLATGIGNVEGIDHDHVRVQLQSTDGRARVEATHLLVATGRTPNTNDLRLDAAGVQTNERGFIRVNDRLETSTPGIFAIGDVNGGPQFTHISYDDFRILRTNLLDGANATTTGRLVPYTVFIDPQLGRVGLTELQARAAQHDVRIARLPMAHVARAIEIGETRGFIKAIVDARTERIVGCAVLGVEGGELMGALQLAITSALPYPVLRDSIFAHPTLAEALNNLFRDAAFD